MDKRSSRSQERPTRVLKNEIDGKPSSGWGSAQISLTDLIALPRNEFLAGSEQIRC